MLSACLFKQPNYLHSSSFSFLPPRNPHSYVSKTVITFPSAVKGRPVWIDIFSVCGLCFGINRSASPRGLEHSDLLTSFGQWAAWQFTQQSLLSKHDIYHSSSQKDGIYPMGGQASCLTICWGLSGAVHARNGYF